jgi:hypothetical protein
VAIETLKSAQHPDELLPWLANGTLAGAERQSVEAHVATCARCRRELAWFETLRSSVAELENAQPPGEFGLNRLLRDIRRQPQQAERRRWLAPALAASLAVVALQGVLLAQFWTRSETIAPLGRLMLDADVLQIRFDPRAIESAVDPDLALPTPLEEYVVVAVGADFAFRSDPSALVVVQRLAGRRHVVHAQLRLVGAGRVHVVLAAVRAGGATGVEVPVAVEVHQEVQGVVLGVGRRAHGAKDVEDGFGPLDAIAEH